MIQAPSNIIINTYMYWNYANEMERLAVIRASPALRGLPFDGHGASHFRPY